MPKYKVYVTVYHCIEDIEADSFDQAKEKASEDHIWDDHIKDVVIDVEPMETLSDLTAYWDKHGNGNGEWEKTNDNS